MRAGRGEDVGEAVALVVGGAGLEERHLRAEGDHEDRDAGPQHQRDGEALGPEAAEVAQELSVQGRHHQAISAGARRLAFSSMRAMRPSAK